MKTSLQAGLALLLFLATLLGCQQIQNDVRRIVWCAALMLLAGGWCLIAACVTIPQQRKRRR